MQDSNKLDILHSHSYSGVTMSPLSKCPVVYTVAYVNFEKTIINLYKLFPNVHFVPMSNFLKKQFKLNWTNVVHNGINAGKFVLPKKENRNMFICIGRIVPEKGIHIATKYCSDKNIKLKIAGPISDQEYFTKKIKPFLGKYVSYVGELNFKEKIKFYQEAKALLNPLQYNEAFGNTMIEAMACGTPIIAFNKGSVPEVVKDQKTGFIVNNIKELGLKINKISEINSLDCRSRVLDNFTYQKMAENYEEIYYKILRQKNEDSNCQILQWFTQ
ncbi:MAG: glycosyltransferase [Patescibacteria group bacterium]